MSIRRESCSPVEPTCARDRPEAGWKIKAKSVAMVAGQLLTTTTFGPTVSRPWSAVKGIDFSAGRIEYLSDLPAESMQWTSYLDLGDTCRFSSRLLSAAPRSVVG